MAGRMHANEVATDERLVRELLVEQFPAWADLPIRRVPSAGTDNAIYRLGEALSVRLPRIDWAIGQIEKEWYWLPRLAPALPLAIPEPLARGTPAAGYPYPWAIYRWLPGENRRAATLPNPEATARTLADFLLALQALPTAGAPDALALNLRGAPLRRRDQATRAAIAQLDDLINPETALALWANALDAPEWSGPPLWFHGDLLPGNLLFHDARLSAVIDFSAAGVGDPAPDLMIAWGLLTGRSRTIFRETLGVDEPTWRRGRGQALAQAAIFIPYYRHTNPVGVAYAKQMLSAVLAEFAASA